MIFVIAFIAVGLAWGLAVRAHIPMWVPLLIPVALAVIGYVLWRGDVDENRNLVLAIMAIVELLTLIALAAGFMYRRHRTP